jgi:hypothetical protein
MMVCKFEVQTAGLNEFYILRFIALIDLIIMQKYIINKINIPNLF